MYPAWHQWFGWRTAPELRCLCDKRLTRAELAQVLSQQSRSLFPTISAAPFHAATFYDAGMQMNDSRMIKGISVKLLSLFFYESHHSTSPSPGAHICFVSGFARIPPWSTSPDFILKPSGQVWNLSLTGRALLQLSRVARGCEWFSSRNIELLKIERSWWQTSIPIGCTEAFHSNGKRRACDGCMCRCLRAHQRRLRLGKEP